MYDNEIIEKHIDYFDHFVLSLNVLWNQLGWTEKPGDTVTLLLLVVVLSLLLLTFVFCSFLSFLFIPFLLLCFSFV